MKDILSYLSNFPWGNVLRQFTLMEQNLCNYMFRVFISLLNFSFLLKNTLFNTGKRHLIHFIDLITKNRKSKGRILKNPISKGLNFQ